MARRRSPGLRLCGASWCSDPRPHCSHSNRHAASDAPLVQRRRISVALTPPNPKPLSMACVTFMGRGRSATRSSPSANASGVCKYSVRPAPPGPRHGGRPRPALPLARTPRRAGRGVPRGRAGGGRRAGGRGGVRSVCTEHRAQHPADWLEDDTPSPSDRKKKGCQRLFNKHWQPFESHITGGKAPLESDQAQQASPQAGAPLPTDARRHQAAGRASAASPRIQRYCRRRPFRGSTTTDWPAATGSD